MTLKDLYQNTRVTLMPGGGYDTRNKEIFGKRALSFLRRACRLAGVKPDKGYPYFNRGGPAVLGDVYLNITLPDNSRRLEFIFGEKLFQSGALYRTNSGRYWNQYGRNIWLPEETTEEDVARIIREFTAERTENNTLETSGAIQ
jgi:hypothetical protein